MTFLGVESVAGYRIKRYEIRYGEGALDVTRFAAGWERVAEMLPQPAASTNRPAVGFAIFHQGRTGDYLVMSWWDQENELPTRVFVRDDSGWRLAGGGESFCVWDLRVFWWEREAYVNTILAGRANAVELYLGIVAEGFA